MSTQWEYNFWIPLITTKFSQFLIERKLSFLCLQFESWLLSSIKNNWIFLKMLTIYTINAYQPISFIFYLSVILKIIIFYKYDLEVIIEIINKDGLPTKKSEVFQFSVMKTTYLCTSLEFWNLFDIINDNYVGNFARFCVGDKQPETSNVTNLTDLFR